MSARLEKIPGIYRRNWKINVQILHKVKMRRRGGLRGKLFS